MHPATGELYDVWQVPAVKKLLGLKITEADCTASGPVLGEADEESSEGEQEEMGQDKLNEGNQNAATAPNQVVHSKEAEVEYIDSTVKPMDYDDEITHQNRSKSPPANLSFLSP